MVWGAGESMGGAVAIKLALRDKGTRVFDGCILLAPMVKIAESMKPPDMVINSLK
jgi:alpha-beta hydrolase superfamily lysophospholipase